MQKAILLEPFIERLDVESFPLVIHGLVDEYGDKDTAVQIEGLVEKVGPDADIVKSMKEFKAIQDEGMLAAVTELLQQAKTQKKPLLPISPEEAIGIAVKYRVTNRQIGLWRRGRITDAAKKGGVTKEELGKLVYLDGDSLDSLLNKMLGEGVLMRDGDGFLAGGDK